MYQNSVWSCNILFLEFLATVRAFLAIFSWSDVLWGTTFKMIYANDLDAEHLSAMEIFDNS